MGVDVKVGLVVNWIVILVVERRFLFCCVNCIVLLVFMDDMISYFFVLECKVFLFLKKWCLYFEMVLIVLIFNVDWSKVDFRFL